MAMTNINIRTDEEVKEGCEELFESLGLNMSTAINIFLRQSLRVGGLPFEVKLDAPTSPAQDSHRPNVGISPNGKKLKKQLNDLAEISETDTLTVYDFSLADIPFRVAFTKQAANKNTRVYCRDEAVMLEQMIPLGISPISQRAVVCKPATLMLPSRRTLLVISGKPDIICGLDEGKIGSAKRYAASPSDKLLYVMSEKAFGELSL